MPDEAWSVSSAPRCRSLRAVRLLGRGADRLHLNLGNVCDGDQPARGIDPQRRAGAAAAEPRPSGYGETWVVTVAVNIRRDPSFKRRPIGSIDEGIPVRIRQRGYFSKCAALSLVGFLEV